MIRLPLQEAWESGDDVVLLLSGVPPPSEASSFDEGGQANPVWPAGYAMIDDECFGLDEDGPARLMVLHDGLAATSLGPGWQRRADPHFRAAEQLYEAARSCFAAVSGCGDAVEVVRRPALGSPAKGNLAGVLEVQLCWR